MPYAGAFTDPFGWSPTQGFVDVTPGAKSAPSILDTLDPRKLFALGSGPVASQGGAAPGGSNPIDAGSGAATVIADGVSEWFVRGTVMILGFIFVAVGLNMFKPREIIQVVKK